MRFFILIFSIVLVMRCNPFAFLSKEKGYPENVGLSHAADLTGDGIAEEVTVFTNVERNRLGRKRDANTIKIISVNQGIRQEVWVSPIIYGGIHSLTVRDIDNDGLMDVLVDLAADVFRNDRKSEDDARQDAEMAAYDYFITYDSVRLLYELRPIAKRPREAN